MLEVENLAVERGKVPVLRSLSFSLQEGQILGIIGGNGAGKSSALLALAGVLPSRGGILLKGRPLFRRSAAAMRDEGIVLVPEGRRLFGEMTVRENLLVGWLRGGSLKEDLDRVLALFPELVPMLSRKAGALSGGQQQLVAVARGLMSRPSILMLDEPTMGLSPKNSERVYQMLTDLSRLGIGVIVTGQEVEKTLARADFVVLLKQGMGSEVLPSKNAGDRLRRMLSGESAPSL
ncbi:MAG: ATP-binding cassette domain-containing protein [Oscillospiraceae bacterium]|nr:ATP-binding cassette domain-containing protein [Oscillospiraceae bacterium]